MPGRSSNSANPNDKYKFTGHERDQEAGLNIDYMGARYYDPAIARFMQVDPLADQFPGWNPYHYVHNNPLNLVDPTGMAACPPEDEPCPDQGEFNQKKADRESANAVAIVASSRFHGLIQLFSPTSTTTSVTAGKEFKEVGVDASVTATLKTDLSENVFEPKFSGDIVGNLQAGSAKVSVGGGTEGPVVGGEFFDAKWKKTENNTLLGLKIGPISFGYSSETGFFGGFTENTPFGSVTQTASYKPDVAVDRTERNVIKPAYNATVKRVQNRTQQRARNYQ